MASPKRYTREQRVAAFWAKVRMTLFCWEWTGSLKPDGYGKFGVGGARTTSAHRFSWEMHFGPIPTGLNVLHRCDNPCCVNPAHLFLGTQADNVSDMISKGRAGSNAGERNPNAKLTADQVREIKARIAGGERHKDIAKDYGVTRQMVSYIGSGEYWAMVPREPVEEAK